MAETRRGWGREGAFLFQLNLPQSHVLRTPPSRSPPPRLSFSCESSPAGHRESAGAPGHFQSPAGAGATLREKSKRHVPEELTSEGQAGVFRKGKAQGRAFQADRRQEQSLGATAWNASSTGADQAFPPPLGSLPKPGWATSEKEMMTVTTYHKPSTYDAPHRVLGTVSAAAGLILTPGPRGCVAFGFPHFTHEKPGSNRRLASDPSLTMRKWQSPNFTAVVWPQRPDPSPWHCANPSVRCTPMQHNAQNWGQA